MATTEEQPPSSVPGQLDEIRQRLDRGEERFDMLERAVAENTEITKDIRDAVIAGKVATKVVKWVGGMAIAGSAIYAFGYQLLHNGKLPHQ